MASNPTPQIAYPATDDQSNARGLCVVMAAGAMSICAANNAIPFGAVQVGAVAGQRSTVALPGAIGEVRVDGAVTAGAELQARDDGRYRAATGADVRVAAIALESAAAANDIIDAIICAGHITSAT